MIVKHQSRVMSQNGEGLVTTIVYQGEQSEIQALQADLSIDESSEYGRLRATRLYQESPKIWCCELQYETNASGEYATPPAKAYGKKTAQLRGSMLSLPLESHKDYKTNWNHYLAAAPGITAIPAWWATAKDTVISNTDAQKYRWVSSPGECPSDRQGLWRTVKDPAKPGVNSYDVATYTIQETARFSSARAAGKMIANTLNKIGTPCEVFGISSGDWKCDSADVSWSGKYWLATLSWTRSGDDKGWDKQLYN